MNKPPPNTFYLNHSSSNYFPVWPHYHLLNLLRSYYQQVLIHQCSLSTHHHQLRPFITPLTPITTYYCLFWIQYHNFPNLTLLDILLTLTPLQTNRNPYHKPNSTYYHPLKSITKPLSPSLNDWKLTNIHYPQLLNQLYPLSPFLRHYKASSSFHCHSF